MNTDKEKILIASDHNGNAARAHIRRFLEKDFQVLDLGPFEYDGKVDYVDYATKLCGLIRQGVSTRGILICGTGTGMSIVANRFPDIRAALVTDVATAYLSREHNDSNVLVLGQWRTPLGSMEDIVKTWLQSKCVEKRHLKRLQKLANLKI